MSVTQIIHQKDGSAEIRFQYDPKFIAQIKHEIPTWGRSYEPAEKAWTVQRPFVEHAVHLARDRFGYVEIYGEPVNFTQNTLHECRCDDAHRTLKVCQDAPPEVVKAAYRELSKSSHPDNCGDYIQTNHPSDAYERALGDAR